MIAKFKEKDSVRFIGCFSPSNLGRIGTVWNVKTELQPEQGKYAVELEDGEGLFTYLICAEKDLEAVLP